MCWIFFLKPFKLLALNCCSILVNTGERRTDAEMARWLSKSEPKGHRGFGFFPLVCFHFVLVWSEPWSEQSPPNACLRAQQKGFLCLVSFCCPKSPFLVNRANPCFLPLSVFLGEKRSPQLHYLTHVHHNREVAEEKNHLWIALSINMQSGLCTWRPSLPSSLKVMLCLANPPPSPFS